MFLGGIMDTLTFGLTMTILGMGCTLLSLWFLTLVVNLLKRFFPYREKDEKEDN
jgi:Na+-transporting methylmalonyl-CoA/oxaloacetate decarboxylase gamma subunit